MCWRLLSLPCAGPLFKHYLGSGHPPILLASVAILGGWLALATHELGHVIAGRLVGFRLQFYAVGPLLVERSAEDRLRVRLNRQLALYGGLAASTPSSLELAFTNAG